MKRHSKPYRCRFDDEIRVRLANGGSRQSIADDLKISWVFVRARVAVLGLSHLAEANGRAASRRSHEVRGKASALFMSIADEFAHRNRKTSQPLAHTPASTIIRSLRYGASRARACIDPDHVIACLHARSVPLPDIEDHLGVPQHEAVAAIRRYPEVWL